MAVIPAAGLEALMASKDKGGKNVKKTAAKDLKQKRLDKKGKHGTPAGNQIRNT